VVKLELAGKYSRNYDWVFAFLGLAGLVEGGQLWIISFRLLKLFCLPVFVPCFCSENAFIHYEGIPLRERRFTSLCVGETRLGAFKL